MFLSQFGFKKDDEQFFDDLCNPDLRRFLVSRLDTSRRRYVIAWYIHAAVGLLCWILAGVRAPMPVWPSILWFFIALVFLGFSLHADAKCKLAKAFDCLDERGHGSRQLTALA